MKCPKQIRQCPHSWTNCELCANLKACEDGTYTPETEINEPELTVDLSIPIVVKPPSQETQPSARGTWAERHRLMSHDERMNEFYKFKSPNLHEKEPYKCMDGPTAPGGGGKCKVPPKPPYKMPEYLKNWGQKP